MDNINQTKSTLENLEVTIHQLLRYGYGGFLFYLVVAIIHPEITKQILLDTLGVPISTILAFMLGATIYTIHRPFIGEPLYYIHEVIHWCLYLIMRKYYKIRDSNKHYGYTCRTAYFMEKHGLGICLASEAFRSVRDSDKYDKKKQNRFHLQNSELHLLYITLFITTIGAFTIFFAKPGSALVTHNVLFFISGAVLLAGFIGRILLCRQECKAMLQIGEKTIEEILEQQDFIESTDITTCRGNKR